MWQVYAPGLCPVGMVLSMGLGGELQLGLLSQGRGLEREAGPKQSFLPNTHDLSILAFPKPLAAALH